MEKTQKKMMQCAIVSIFFFITVSLSVFVWNSTFFNDCTITFPCEFTPKYTFVGENRVIDAPFIDQRKRYPTGCESISAVMALQYLGVGILPEQFIDSYLPQGNAPYLDHEGCLIGDDPRKCFLGSPYSEDGWGCYSPVIKEAMSNVVGKGAISIEELRGESLDFLMEKYVSKGFPVLIWGTIDMVEPQDGSTFYIEGTCEEFTWVYPTHCLLLVGETDTSYIFNDPLRGKCHPYDKTSVERSYDRLGQQAVAAVYDNENMSHRGFVAKATLSTGPNYSSIFVPSPAKETRSPSTALARASSPSKSLKISTP